MRSDIGEPAGSLLNLVPLEDIPKYLASDLVGLDLDPNLIEQFDDDESDWLNSVVIRELMRPTSSRHRLAVRFLEKRLERAV